MGLLTDLLGDGNATSTLPTHVTGWSIAFGSPASATVFQRHPTIELPDASTSLAYASLPTRDGWTSVDVRAIFIQEVTAAGSFYVKADAAAIADGDTISGTPSGGTFAVVAAPGTAGDVFESTLRTAVDVTDKDFLDVVVARAGGDATNDTAASDLHLLAVKLVPRFA